MLTAQFAIAIYGGYFGAGIGFMMLAALTLYGMRDIHAMNGLKLVLALCMTVVSSIAFVYAGKVYWTEALVMCVATLIGGYGGALGAKKVKPELHQTLHRGARHRAYDLLLYPRRLIAELAPTRASGTGLA